MTLAAIAGRLLPSTANRVGPIGLQFANDELHLVQLARHRDGTIRMRARCTIEYPESRQALLASPAALKKLLATAMRANRFKGRRVIAAMPIEHLRILSVTYQTGNDETDADAIARLMADRLDGELDDYVLDYVPVETVARDNERLAMVAVSPREHVIDFLELLRHAGLAVEALEIGPVAIQRLVNAVSGEDKLTNVLVVNFGRTRSYMTMISGGRMLFDQDFGFGEESVLAHVASSLDMDVDMVRRLVMRNGLDRASMSRLDTATMTETGAFNTLVEIIRPEFLQLVEEIRRAFIYAASETRGRATNKVFVLGSIARWPGADQLIGRLADLPVSTLPDPIKFFGPAADNLKGKRAGDAPLNLPEIAVATGLALRGLQ